MKGKKGVEMAWYYILGFIILFALLIWFIFFSAGVSSDMSEALKKILWFWQ